MKVSWLPLILCLTCWAGSAVEAQVHLLTGSVVDAETGVLLPSATIRVLRSSKGTVTNTDGRFRLPLSAGRWGIVVSYVGYQSETLSVDLQNDLQLDIRLRGNSVQMAAVTVTDEDPAYEIIRRAIDAKGRWMSQLTTTEGKAFNRLQLTNDTAIAAITEAYSTLFWRRGDSLREVITQQRLTGNLPSSMNASTVGEVLNFNDDRIRQGGFTFVGPTAPDAFNHYDYRLLSTRTMDGAELYDIELIPRSVITPLFRGRITVSERSHAVMSVDVRPNEAFSQLFVSIHEPRYRQEFRLYDGRFWLPATYSYTASYHFAFAGISLPVIGIRREVVIYDYAVNVPIADSIAALQKVTIDSSAARVDSLFWREHEVLPLDERQQTAYAELDSTQTLEKRFAPTGAAASLLTMSDGWLSYPDLWFNRVEGVHLGVSRQFRDVTEGLDLRGAFGYGLSDRTWKWSGGLTFRFGPKVTNNESSGMASFRSADERYTITLDLYDLQHYVPVPVVPGLLLNSVSVLLARNDVHDYYRSIGGEATATMRVTPQLRVNTGILRERQMSVFQTTSYSILARNGSFAVQPGIVDGTLTAVKAGMTLGTPGVFSVAKDAYRITASVERALSGAGGDFSYAQWKGKVRLKFATMLGEQALFPPTFGMQIAGGTTVGSVPPQRYFELYSRFETLAGYGTLKALPRRKFYGDRYVAVTMDHNFRRLLFAPLGLRRLMESTLELIVEGNAARSWMSGTALRSSTFPSTDSGGWYFEASIGVSNIFDLFRLDVTRRFSAPGDWAVSLSVTDFLMGLIAP